MSRALVKEPDDTTALDVPERPISLHRNEVTPQGLAQIEAEEARARRTLADARAREDRAALAVALRDVRYWSAQRASAHAVLGPSDTTAVHFGSEITIVRNDGREQTFRLVGQG